VQLRPIAKSLSIGREHHEIIRSVDGRNERGLSQLCGGQVNELTCCLFHSVHRQVAAAHGAVKQLFDNLIGAGEQRRWNLEGACF
jgi:hypothetical protein